METSKIHVEATSFQKAMTAVIAVAPSQKGNDLVQFRIVGDELTISARSQTEAIAVGVETLFLDLDYERDAVFEITRAEAIAMSSMKMKKEHQDDELELGLLIHETYIVRTDESGLGLGLRSVKVRRHGVLYDSVLGDVPHALARATDGGPTEAKPRLDGRQWGLLGKVAKALDLSLSVYAISDPGDLAVRTVALGSNVVMSLVWMDVLDDEDPAESGRRDGELEGQTSIEVVASNVQTANPPKGIA